MTRAAGLLVLSLGAASLAGCTKQGFLKAPEADEAAAVGGFSSDMHFLLEPTSDAESLLGRQVQVSAKGAWTVADERAPGCEVRVKRASAKYKKRHRIGLGDLTSFSGGYKEMLSLEARYGRSVEAEFQIDNTETLTADVAGPCGDVIVKSVRVGSGFRTLVRKAEAGAKGRVGKGPIGAEGGREAATEALDSMEWSDPQAYAFSYDRVTQTKPFDFTFTMPDKIEDGDALEFSLGASDTAYVIVFFLEESGAGDVMYPTNQMPLVTVQAKATLTLPTPGEAQIKAQLRDPKTPARETLVVYAFTDRADFERFKPQSLGAGEVTAYAAKLTAELATVPISRWARATATYEIVPKGSK